MQAERVILSEMGVTVTDRRVVTPWQSYAIAHVASVRCAEYPRLKRINPGVWACLGLGLLMMAAPDFVAASVRWAGLSLALTCGVLLLWYLRMRLPLHAVFITMSGRDLPIAFHHDRALIERVTAAVSQAISR